MAASSDPGNAPTTSDRRSRPTVDIVVPPAPTSGAEPVRNASFGRYVLLDVLGVGGMGVVHTAYDPKLDRKIALKILHDKGQRSGTGRARMVREAQALAKLTHPNIVMVHDVDVHDGRLYIAMEYIEGVALDAWLERRGHGWREIVEAFVAAGRGLAAAHAHGITHRDFKPGNVVMGADGRVRVLDFGLAKTVDAPDPATAASSASLSQARQSADALARTFAHGLSAVEDSLSDDLSDATGVRLTQAGRAVGTPAFMSPEQLFGLPVGPATDQFSFAVALFEALYGVLPFAEDRDPDFVAKVSGGIVREPPATAVVPGWVHRALRRALCPAPEDRYPTMDALLSALILDPARRRRRVGGAAAALALAGLAAFGVAQGMQQQPTACTGAGDKMDVVWDEARRASAQAAFQATALPYAPHAWDLVDRALGDYAAAWSERHVEICEATHVRHEQSPALMDVRMACLDRARAQFSGLARELVDADAPLVGRAAAAVQSLPPLETCPDQEAKLDATRLDPVTQTAIRALQADLAAVAGVIAAGRPARALHLNEPILAQARALGRKAVIAEALVLHARILRMMGKPDEAIALAEQGVVAARQGGDAQIEVVAWSELMFIEGTTLENVERALAFGLAADAALAELEDRDVDVATQVYLAKSRGSVLLKAGRHEDARVALARAAELARGIHAGVTRAEVLINLGICLARLGRPLASVDRLTEAAAVIEELYGDQHPRMGAVAINLGNVLVVVANTQKGDRRDAGFSAARAHYERGLRIYRAVHGEHHIKTVAALMGLAHLERAAAVQMMQAEQPLRALSRWSAARAWALEARAVLSTQARPPRTQLARMDNFLGDLDVREGRVERDEVAARAHLTAAVGYYTDARQAYASVVGDTPDLRVARILAALCHAQRRAGNAELAREHCTASLAMFHELGGAAADEDEVAAMGDLGLLSPSGDPAGPLMVRSAADYFTATQRENPTATDLLAWSSPRSTR